jgi:uncharacterized protein
MTIALDRIKTQRSNLKPWYAYAGGILSGWIVLTIGFGLLPEVLQQWPMALIMILGSLVAGSTPMGGGAVSFPVLVLWLGVSPNNARDFGLMIQAVGMTSAMIFILCRRVPIQRGVLLWSIAGAMAGMFLGTMAIAPRIPGNYVKLVFACMWMSFGILTIVKERELRSLVSTRALSRWSAMQTGVLVGLIGGVIASVIGVGVEMVLYTTLVLLHRCDVKVAVPTAVSAMAVTSIMGVAAQLWVGHISRDVTMKFLAASPLVIFGAPIGTYIVSVIPRPRTLYVISGLCMLQFVWTLVRLQRTLAEWTFVLTTLALAVSAFSWMYTRGQQGGHAKLAAD